MQTITELSKPPLPFPLKSAPGQFAAPESAPENTDDAPRVHKWTKDEYYRLAELDFFANKRTELIDGEIFEMPTMKSPHATVVSLADESLRQLFVTDFAVRSQLPLDFGADELVPDIAIVMGKTRDYAEAHPTTAVLVVEVADTTLWHDRNRKLKLYALRSVPEYWIVNINQRCLEVYRRPIGDAYTEIFIFNELDLVSPIDKPDAQIAVRDLLP